jgi:hypothetical protein
MEPESTVKFRRIIRGWFLTWVVLGPGALLLGFVVLKTNPGAADDWRGPIFWGLAVYFAAAATLGIGLFLLVYSVVRWRQLGWVDRAIAWFPLGSALCRVMVPIAYSIFEK